MGKAIPGSRVAVVDDDGNKVDTNVKGNIALPLDFLDYLKVTLKMRNVQKRHMQEIITLLEI